MKTAEYLEMIAANQVDVVAERVNSLTNQERIELRTELEKAGCKKIVRNLYFNYQTQEWI